MGEECGHPVCRPMTAIAVHGRREVIRRLESGYHSPAWRVALHTLRGSSTKNSLEVASFALDLRMAACECKAGRTVIDLDIGPVTILCFAIAWQHYAATEHERTKSEREPQISSGPVGYLWLQFHLHLDSQEDRVLLDLPTWLHAMSRLAGH